MSLLSYNQLSKNSELTVKNIMLLIVSIFGLSLSTLFAQEKIEQTNAAMRATTFGSSIPGMVNDHIQLGTAYHSGRKKFLNHQPVEGIVSEEFGNVKFTIETGIDMGYDRLLNVLNGKIDLEVNFPVVRVGAGARIAKESTASSYSSSYTFSLYTTPKKRVLLPKDPNIGFTLSPVGEKLANNFQLNLHDMAGDEFVSSIEYGAQIFVNMKVDFLDENSKSDIGGYLGVDIAGGVVSVDGKLNFLDEDTKKSVRITVVAMQKGGDPKQLIRIIPNNIITCTLDNPEPCFQLFSEAIRYANSDFKTQFNSLSDYNVVGYQTTRYDKSSLELLRLVPEYQEIRFATRYKILELEDAFKQAALDEQRASDLLVNYYSWMPAEQRALVEDIKKAAYDNAWLYFDAARFCNNNPYGDACLDYWEQVENYCTTSGRGCIVSYDINQLEVASPDVTRWFRCEVARQVASYSGLVADSQSLAYRKLRWAPVFIDNSEPNTGIYEWAPCEFALTTYGEYFTD
ncbi:MAG: internalin [Pseudomonadota bacterium]